MAFQLACLPSLQANRAELVARCLRLENRVNDLEAMLKTLHANMEQAESWPHGLQHFFDFWRPKINYALEALESKEDKSDG